MALDPAAIAKGLQESGGYYVAALLVVAVSFVFALAHSAMSARIADAKARAEELITERNSLALRNEALQAQKDSQYERVLIAVNGVIAIQVALEKKLSRKTERTGT